MEWCAEGRRDGKERMKHITRSLCVVRLKGVSSIVSPLMKEAASQSSSATHACLQTPTRAHEVHTCVHTCVHS